MVKPSKTSTNVMLMVDVIFAFTNRAVDIFFFFDIKKGYTKKKPIILNKTVFPNWLQSNKNITKTGNLIW